MADLNEKQIQRLADCEAVLLRRGLAQLPSADQHALASKFEKVESLFLQRHAERLRPLRLAVLASYTTHHLVRLLKLFLYEMGVAPQIYEGEYDAIETELRDARSAVFEFRPEALLLLPSANDVKDFPPLFAPEETVRQWLDATIRRNLFLWDRVKTIPGCQVVHCLPAQPAARQLGNIEAYHPTSRTRLMRMLEDELVRQRPSHVILFDMEHLAARMGKDRWFDEVNYFLSKQGMSLDAMGLAAHALSRTLAAYKGRVRKCLVLDLDNTLWGGVVGDDGVGGIVLGNNDPVGEAFMAFQEYVQRLRERGVILAVCSKNEEAAARAPFSTHPEMCLKESDFACFIANWDDKATNLRRIADNLNIGTDSLVFFDDNPAERDIVRRFLPEVEVIEVPDDPAFYVRALDAAACFEWIALTPEDIGRAASYAAEHQRQALHAEAVDYPAYLRSLEMRATVGSVGPVELPRFVQLINKSNQFNLRTQRYTDAAISAMRDEPARFATVCVALRDRFTNYGIISCLILERRQDTAFIDTWVMSCRVLKRGVEELAFNALLAAARGWGCAWLAGEYVPTAKNAMVRGLLPAMGFQPRECGTAGVEGYRLDVTIAGENPHQIHLEAPAFT